MEKRYTPDRIETLAAGEIFVFGSNRAGRHGAGAAKTAADKFGARYGIGEGMQGRSYAIPTKDTHLATLPVAAIGRHVARFLAHARKSPQLTFLVTKIGCGLAGYKARDVAPLFQNVPPNVILSKEFHELTQR